jgi:hypothetical protein
MDNVLSGEAEWLYLVGSDQNTFALGAESKQEKPITMYQPEAYAVALAFMITTMICWGSWANTMK